MYIGDQYFNLKNLSKNQRKELRELKRLYEEAVANGITPFSPTGRYSREDKKGRVTKSQLEKLATANYEDIYKARTLRESLEAKGIGKPSDTPLPKSKSLFKDHPELQVIGGGQILDTDTGEIFKDKEDYLRKKRQEQDPASELLEGEKTYKSPQEERRDKGIPDYDYDTDEVEEYEGDTSDTITVDNFLDSIKPYYRKQTYGTQTAQELYDAISEFRDEFGDEKTAEMIESMPTNMVSKVQSSNSVDRYEGIEQCLDYLYSYFFNMDYYSGTEEWNE